MRGRFDVCGPKGLNVFDSASTFLMTSTETAKSANEYVVHKAPSVIRYIPNFISEEEEDALLKCVYEAPSPKWDQLLNRRLQNWGGIVNSKGMISDGPLPKWLSDLIDKIVAVPDTFPAGRRPNHVLINEYKPGQGIMPHTDGPAYFPLISTVSLGSDTLLDFYEKANLMENLDLAKRYVGSMFVQRRSLLLLNETVYNDLHHGIRERTSDKIDDSVFNADESTLGQTFERGTRVSLTIRHCPKVAKLSLNNLLLRR
uniref:Fe2OG dioxygenase domain-containing protein n=1 Tax=Steinernema glaseri TaxID=37863 RepID=A0A1I7Y0J0_9BILA